MNENKKHPHYDVIVAWAEGKEIQNRRDGSLSWNTLSSNKYAPSFSPEWQYRVKPKMVRYKRFLWRRSGNFGTPERVLIVHPDEQKYEPREAWLGFVRWIDKEWQEVEV